MERDNFYERPTLVFFDHYSNVNYGIAYRDKIICCCCGVIIDVDEVCIEEQLDHWVNLNESILKECVNHEV